MRRCQTRQSRRSGSAVAKYRAPSWSWASADYSVKFDLALSMHYVECRRDQEEDYRRGRAVLRERIRLKVLEASVELVGDDRYGQVRGGPLVVEGRVRKLVPHSGGSYTFFPDDPGRKMTREMKRNLLCLAVDAIGDGWGRARDRTRRYPFTG